MISGAQQKMTLHQDFALFFGSLNGHSITVTKLNDLLPTAIQQILPDCERAQLSFSAESGITRSISM